LAPTSWARPKDDPPNTFPTLGYQVADWIESRCAIPDREMIGEPFLLTDEQLRFLLHFYRLDPDTGDFYYVRGGQLTRPQKWGKGPLSAAVICAEAQGPVRFDRWDPEHRDGVIGKPVATPLIQVTAVSEDQTDNVYSALLPMIELGALHGEVEDTGLGRINLPGGGRIVPVTASAVSRLGQRITFAVQDQTESWTEGNKGRKLADNQRRGLAGMGGRWLSTPNAWDPTEESVAQYTAEFELDGVYHDDVTPPDALSVRNKVERRRALKIAYGDAVLGTRDGKVRGVRPWIDLDRIDTEIVALLPRDPAQAERWFLNRKEAGEAKAFSGDRWDELARPKFEVPKRDLIVIGVDGARFADALAIVATQVRCSWDPTSPEFERGHQWPLGIWERPPSAPDDYEHPFDLIDGAMQEAFEIFDVWRVYVDPQYIEYLLKKWQGDFGEKKVLPWWTNRPKQMAWAVRNYSDALASGIPSHDGNADMARHMKNAVRSKVNVYDDDHRQMHTVSKDRPDSPRKIDAAPAAVISWEARQDAIAAGAKPRRSYRAGGFN
jgi:hypothetical protein